MSPTITEIARKANVSIATVSRALNPHTRPQVAGPTLKKIERLALKHAYTPNAAARNLRQSSTRTIGVVVPFYRDIFYSAYYTHLLSGVSNTLEGSGYQFKLLTLSHEQKTWDHYDFRSGEQVDGLIVSLWFRFFSNKSVLEKIKVPTIVIDDYEKNVNARFICGDHFQGGRIAAQYLCSAGHRHLAIITGPSWSRDCRQRVAGFKDYLEKEHPQAQLDAVVCGDYVKDRAKVALDDILRKHPQTTAIFCCTDIMAGGVLERLEERGIECAKDISVMGYDNDFMVLTRHPQLTSIHVPVYDMAKEAAENILEILKKRESKKGRAGAHFLPVHLVERTSVKKMETR